MSVLSCVVAVVLHVFFEIVEYELVERREGATGALERLRKRINLNANERPAPLTRITSSTTRWAQDPKKQAKDTTRQ